MLHWYVFFYFRHVPKDGDTDKDIQTTELYKSIVKDGLLMMSKMTFNGKLFIHVSFLNYRTHIKHVNILLKLIKTHE